MEFKKNFKRLDYFSFGIRMRVDFKIEWQKCIT